MYLAHSRGLVMRRLIPLVFVLACAACARRAEEPRAPEPVPVVVADAPPVVAPAPLLPVPEPLPVEAGRTNGVGKRVVINGLAVWVESVEYKEAKAVWKKTGENAPLPRSKRLIIAFGLQSADPTKTFEYTTWAGRTETFLVRDALGRGWSNILYSDTKIQFGRVESAIVTFEKPVVDVLVFDCGQDRTPSREPDFAGARYLDIDLPQPPEPFDESRVYRFRVRVSEFK